TSHQNPLITKIYKDFFGQPNSEKAHHLLHTHYEKRALYRD
ncbi:MAG TPA: iron hydrogenase small subunit, partial [Treponemataceae bacterium]|nr:iron hydrogenase small subunit [Treponemataceae bacterium]